MDHLVDGLRRGVAETTFGGRKKHVAAVGCDLHTVRFTGAVARHQDLGEPLGVGTAYGGV